MSDNNKRMKDVQILEDSQTLYNFYVAISENIFTHMS